MRPEPVSGVYFVQAPGTGPIKIGESGDVHARVRQLQLGSPVAIRLVGIVAVEGETARQALERRLHRQLAKYRIHGEWFKACPDVAAAIKAQQRPEAS